MPEKTELRGFSNYFTSFLTTSFELVETPMIDNNKSSCFCEICLQFTNLTHLKSIAPKKHDRRIAEEKWVEIVHELASFYQLDLSESIAKEIGNAKWTIKQIASLAYAKALFQRIEYGEGDVFILALWRQIAWNENGAPIKGFVLKAQEILAAERKVKREMINWIK